jgi:hypothetical protein
MAAGGEVKMSLNCFNGTLRGNILVTHPHNPLRKKNCWGGHVQDTVQRRDFCESNYAIFRSRYGCDLDCKAKAV